MPFPNPDTQWSPGQSGNPGGHSRGRRITAAIHRILDEQGLDRQLAMTYIAKALGDAKPLGDRKPDWTWFNALFEIVDGRRDEPTATVEPTATDAPKRIVIPDVDDRLTPRED